MLYLERYLLGIDPGLRTGVALVDVLAETCDGFEVQFDECGDKLERIIEQHRPDVVAERFVINTATATNTQAPWALEIIGVARYLAGKYGCRFAIRSQSSAVNFADDAKLRRLGWYVPGKRHLKRAQQQALLFAAENQWWHRLLDDDFTRTINDMK